VNEGGTVDFTVSRTTPTVVDTVVKTGQGDATIKVGEMSAILQVATQDNTTYGPDLDVVVTLAAEFGGASAKGQVPDNEQAQLNAPSIMRVMDDVVPINGRVVVNGSTNDRTPTVRIDLTSTGAVAGDKVQLFNGTKALGEAVVLTAADITNGVVIITPATLSDGAYTLTATILDAAGNTSTTSVTYQVTVKATVASVAAATFLAVAADSPTADVPSGTTVASSPVTSPAINDVEQQGSTSLLTGTSEPLSTVRIQDGGGMTGSANANAAGHWSLPVSFTDAVHTLISQCHDLIRCSRDVNRDHPLELLEVRRTDRRFGGRPPDRKRRERRVGRRAGTRHLRPPQRFRQGPGFQLYARTGQGCLRPGKLLEYRSGHGCGNSGEEPSSGDDRRKQLPHSEGRGNRSAAQSS
jgi:hypothetical protein